MYLVTWTTRNLTTGEHTDHWAAHSSRRDAFEQYQTLIGLPFVYAVSVAQPIASTDYDTFRELAA